MLQMGQPVDDVLVAVKESGRQLVEHGNISPSTLNTISRELVSREAYVREINKRFQQMA
jgi:hypothetical protein